jgi:hypothetical protein
MARRIYVQSAEPYAQINSTCFIASVQLNQLGQKILQPVYKPDGTKTPTTQNGILRLMDGIDGWTEAGRNTDLVGMVASKNEIGSSIDGAIAEYDSATVYHLVGTRSF